MENKTKMSTKGWLVPAVIALVLILLIVGASFWSRAKSLKSQTVKIGIVTDLSGPAAYWGESSRAGAELAEKELEEQGYNVDLIFEDYQLEAPKALSSAQKLVNVDNVDAVYAEFNLAAASIGSFIKDKNKIFIYDASVTSPLEGNNNAFKTYLDFQAGNKLVAEKFKGQGVGKIGVLKMNLEPGELGLIGVKEVYGNNAIVESYDLGTTDLKTQVLKLKNSGVGAIINVAAFEGDTLNTLKAMKELDYKVPFGTVDDSITQNVLDTYRPELEGAYTFGFPEVDKDFSDRLASESGKKLATEYGAAITYTHIKQIVKSLVTNKMDIAKASQSIENSKTDSTIGFEKFNNRIADLKMTIKQY